MTDAPEFPKLWFSKEWLEAHGTFVMPLGVRDIEYLRADLFPQWQPIETAPRDGTEILGYREGLGTWIVNWDPDEQDFSPGWTPTHWMPLPEPPDGD